MTSHKLCAVGSSAALDFAVQKLQAMGYSFTDLPDSTVTHLLLPVPSLESSDTVKGGIPLKAVLQNLAPEARVIGGNLPPIPNAADLLKNPAYVTENAYITAQCALRIILQKLSVPLRGCPVLVIGWGRIGKCLSSLLKGLEAQVAVAARKPEDRAMLSVLGYGTVPTAELDPTPYRVIVNTAPAEILTKIPPDILAIDLASQKGLAGPGVLWARGLPGKDMPQASGELIANTILSIKEALGL